MKLYKSSAWIKNELCQKLFGNKARQISIETGKTIKKGKTIRGKSKLIKRAMMQMVRDELHRRRFPSVKKQYKTLKNGEKVVTNPTYRELSKNRQRTIRQRLAKGAA